jgi:hypothetical protein
MPKQITPIRQAVTQFDLLPGIPLPDQDQVAQGFVTAFLNAGRWVVRCPDDPDGLHSVEVHPGDATFVCAACYPGMRKSVFKMRADGYFDSVPDAFAQAEAFSQATADGHTYVILFPDNADEILAVVRQRPTANMNWLPGEDIDFLMAENVANGVSANQPNVTVVNGGE